MKRLAFSSALEGTFMELDAFLGWIEADVRHLRVDSIKIDPNAREPGLLKAQITLLSLAEKSRRRSPRASLRCPETPKASKPTS